MALTWDKTLFDEMYSATLWTHGVRGSPRVPSVAGYYKFGKLQHTTRVVAGLLSQPGWASVTDLIILGGGFGWIAEALIAEGVNVVVVDTSPYVQANIDVSEETEIRAALTDRGFDPDNLPILMDPDDPNAIFTGDPYLLWTNSGVRTTLTADDILDEDLANNGSRNRVQNALPGNADAILTEFLLESSENDTEAADLATLAEDLRKNPAQTVVHLVTGGDAGDPRLNFKTQAEWKSFLTGLGFGDHIVATTDGVWI